MVAGASTVHVVELEERRRKLAHDLGATLTVDPLATDPVEAIVEITGGRGADIVIEAGGNEKTMSLAPQLARAQGTVVVIGLHNEPVRINLFTLCVRKSRSEVHSRTFTTWISRKRWPCWALAKSKPTLSLRPAWALTI